MATRSSLARGVNTHSSLIPVSQGSENGRHEKINCWHLRSQRHDLELLRDVPDVETHVVVSGAARLTLALETDFEPEIFETLADKLYKPGDLAAAISSGSFTTAGMVVVPCSMKTLSGIANSYADNLLLRAADVVLKERRRLVLVVRETPLHLGHLRLLTQVTEMGAVVMPPMPAFYHRPRTIQDIVDPTISRILDLFDIELDTELVDRWQGPPHE